MFPSNEFYTRDFFFICEAINNSMTVYTESDFISSDFYKIYETIRTGGGGVTRLEQSGIDLTFQDDSLIGKTLDDLLSVNGGGIDQLSNLNVTFDAVPSVTGTLNFTLGLGGSTVIVALLN